LARIKYIRDPPFIKQDDVNARRGINALELGSGNGFLSVCLMALAANQIPLREVVVTDLSDHLKLMKKTVDKNNHVYKSTNIEYKEDRNIKIYSSQYTQYLLHHLWYLTCGP